jgi:acetyl-CoA carboxylase carboxyltransferase component
MKLCDAFDIPLVFLVDTPGIMVGPEIEKTALVRHSSRMFVVGADVSVPCMAIILRKAYGLGAIAMTAGSYREPYFTVSWPTGEFGGMGLEGQVKLGFRNQLAAIEDTEERRKTFDQMVARAYERGKALNEAVTFGVDDTIDPADSRKWVASVLKSVRIPPRPHGKKRGAIDTW